MMIGQNGVTSVPNGERNTSNDVRTVYLNLSIMDGRTVRTRGRWGEGRQQTSSFPSATSFTTGEYRIFTSFFLIHLQHHKHKYLIIRTLSAGQTEVRHNEKPFDTCAVSHRTRQQEGKIRNNVKTKKLLQIKVFPFSRTAFPLFCFSTTSRYGAVLTFQ